MDVKHFYLSGGSVELTDLCIKGFAGDRRRVLDKALGFLLDNQFIVSDEIPNRLWQCIKGSGMGHKHSGEVVGLAFYYEVEEWAIRTSTRQEYGIVGYWRYRDDILIIGNDRQLTVKYCQTLRNKASLFKLECEGFFSSSVHFLEVRITKAPTSYEYGPEFKPTSLQIPLATDSAHPRHVHCSWPIGQLKRFERISSSRTKATEAKKIFMNRFIEYQANPHIMDLMKKYELMQYSGQRSYEKLVKRYTG